MALRALGATLEMIYQIIDCAPPLNEGLKAFFVAFV